MNDVYEEFLNFCRKYLDMCKHEPQDQYTVTAEGYYTHCKACGDVVKQFAKVVGVKLPWEEE